MNQSFWRGRRVFVTGHTGFKGSWLTSWLSSLGAVVSGLALNPITTPSLFDLAAVSRVVDSIIGDVRDAGVVRDALVRSHPEVVFHLAAQPLVRVAYEDPAATFATNVLGTANVLDEARRIPSIRSVVVITTDKCYRDEGWVWPYRENDALGGHDPYSSSKACAELVTESFRRSYFEAQNIGLATARAGNVIGGGDWSRDRLVPDLVTACQKGSDVLLRRPESIRPWQHVLDPLHGYLLLAERVTEAPEGFSEAWNLGPDAASMMSVGEVARRFTTMWGQGGVGFDEQSGPHETHALRLDSSKARSRLGWQPLIDVEEGLEWTLDGYKALYAGAGARMLAEQIARYEDRLNDVPVL